MVTRVVSVFLAALSLSIGAQTPADDWPSWRGPSMNGVTPAKNLPERWSDQDNVAWRMKLPGAGVSTPIVSGAHVFVTSQVGVSQRRAGNHPSLTQGSDASGERNLTATAKASDVTFALSAYRLSDGTRVWQHETRAAGPLTPVHDKHNLSTPSPVSDGRVVVAWYGTGQVVTADASTGNVLWTKHLGMEYGPFEINWGHSSSPAMHDSLVIFPCYHERGTYLLALDKRTGVVRWKRDSQPPAHSYSTPAVISHNGTTLVVLNSSRGVEAFDAATGKSVWHVLEDNRFPIPMPVQHQDTLYLSRGYRSSPYLAIRLGGSGDISKSHVVWRNATGAPYVSSLVYYDGLLYMGSELGIVTAIDPVTGQSVWRERVGGVFTASPIAGDGKVYFASETGETIVLRAGGTPQVLARNRVNMHIVASPAAARGRLLFRGDDELIAVGR
jgi:outer membrane protein assembly factor BamB